MANEVATAARTTLANTTARVWHRSFFHPPNPRLGQFVATQEGVTDMARRRTRTELDGPATVEEWTARLLARYPWLDDEEEADSRERSRPVAVYAGTTSFFKFGDRWTSDADGEVHAPARGTMDPLWIVEVLVHANETVAHGEEAVRDAACQRWEFRVDPGLYDRTHDSSRRPLRLAGDAWIDRDGCLRRVTWTRLQRRRSRSPRNPPAGSRSWQTTELWDFGLPVDIELPTVEPERSPPFPVALMELGWKLWQRKRAYGRRHPGA